MAATRATLRQRIGLAMGAWRASKDTPPEHFDIRFPHIYARINQAVTDTHMRFGHYEGAGTGRLYGDWSTRYDTPYWNYRDAREALIARCLKMVDNNPVAKSVVETIVGDVVSTGLRPTPRVKLKNGAPVEGINKVLAEQWKRYDDEWDAAEQSTFSESQQQILREIINCGACLTNKVRSASGRSFGVSTQIVNVLRLDTSRDEAATNYSDDPATKQTVFGVNVDERGAARSYWIQGINKPVSSTSMHQVYRRMRAEEFTGVPWWVAALRWLWASEQLTQDKLVASRIQAMIGLLFPTDQWNAAANKANADSQFEMSQGKIWRYDPKTGGKPELLQADDSVAEVLIPLTQMLHYAICVSMGWSYQAVMRDTNQASFASARVNTMRDRQISRMMQRWFAKTCCQWEWEHFVYRCFLEGKVPGRSLTDYIGDPWYYNQCQWQAPGWEFTDPGNESKAHISLRDAGLETLQTWCNEYRNCDWHDHIDQLADEQEYAKSKGVDLKQQPKPAAQPGAQNKPDEKQPDEPAENTDEQQPVDEGNQDAPAEVAAPVGNK